MVNYRLISLALTTGSACAVVKRFARSGLRFPKRAWGGAWEGQLIWGQLSHGRVLSMLKNPSYAGSYVFGRYQYHRNITPDGHVQAQVKTVPMANWRVYLPGHHEGYISQEEFEDNQVRLARNRTNGEGCVLNGPAREGLTLLQGLVICGCCGRAITVRYQNHGSICPVYLCNWQRREGLATRDCLAVRSDLLDDAVSAAMFSALLPAELEIAISALKEIEQRDQAIMRQWNMRIERAEYDASLAEKRYQECDPANRLVAATLERRWNDALQHLESLRTESSRFRNQKTRIITPDQEAMILALAQDLPRLWNASTTQQKDRKRMIRMLIKDITIEKKTDQHQLVLHIRWQGGTCTDLPVVLPKPIFDVMRYPTVMVDRVRELSRNYTDLQIVEHLNNQGFRSPHGKPFTFAMIKWIRYKYKIAAANLMRHDEFTVKQVASRLQVSTHMVYYWISRHVVVARKLDGRGAWWITLNEAKEHELRNWILRSAHLVES
ncbi:recombinase family protein [Salmonella enterica]|nr:recombinase family protein [Salmonella enterica]